MITEQALLESQLKAMAIYDANNTCMTVNDCAEYLDLHPKTITNHIHSGKIQAVFLGKGYSIPKIQFVKRVIENFKK